MSKYGDVTNIRPPPSEHEVMGPFSQDYGKCWLY